jgi:hypothetical protein
MEPRQAEPESAYSLTPDPDTIERMYRDVITLAINDMGTGTAVESAEVRRWMISDSFGICCELANWNERWARDLLNSIEYLGESVRGPITRECLIMLRAVIRNTTGSTRGYELVDIGGDWVETKVIYAPESHLSRMNRLKQDRARGNEVGEPTDTGTFERDGMGMEGHGQD